MTTQLLLIPYVTEKTSSLMSQNKFVFLMKGSANKIELSKHFSNEYSVNILKVNVLKKRGKKVRRGRILGKGADFLKVVVTLSDDKNMQKIKDLF
jgi:large subunit ribosomal protein L23